MASPRKRGPAEPKEINTRKNFDKRTIRKMYSAPFESAISKEMGRRSEEGGDRAVLQYSSQDVQVFCRKRPFSRAELEMKEFDVLRVGPDGAPMLHDCRMHPDLQHAFLSNHCFPVPCFDEHTSTEDICRSVQLHQLFEVAQRGGHGTVCMFGQTGSGKTYTMQGILQHAASSLFRGSQDGGLMAAAGVRARVACFEVCGKVCYDLLKSGEKVQVREDSSGAVQVSAATVEVRSGHALLEVLGFATSQRVSCSTLKNMASSRSHAFYRLYMSPPAGSKQERGGSLTFVDLAGSERSNDSRDHTREQIKQSVEINTSLAALKECVRVRSQQLRTGNKSLRVPYRSSPLTMLLRDSFETDETSSKAQSRTVVVVTVAPGSADTEHTLNTLRNACMMAGLEPNSASETRTDVPLVDHEAHQATFKGVVKHPAKWTKAEVTDWFNTACNGAFKRAGGALRPELDGKALMRKTEVHFKLLANGDATVGAALYKAFKAETQRANASKAKAAEAVRTAKAAFEF